VDPGVLPGLRRLFSYAQGDDRATGYLYTEGDQDWPASFADVGSTLLTNLECLLGVRFTIVAFQAYRDGAGCDWHDDSAFDEQAVLSLGVTRTFGIRRPSEGPQWTSVAHGDLVYMPSGFQTAWQHCVPVEDVAGERCSLVFRTVAKG